MQPIDKTFMKRYSRVVALSSFNRNIKNWMITHEGRNYLLKEIRVQDKQRDTYETFFIELLEYCRRRNRYFSQFSQTQIEIKVIKESTSTKYLVIRQFHSGWSLKRMLADRTDSIVDQMSLKRLIYCIIDLFINTIDLHHILLTPENILIQKRWDRYYFGVNLTSMSDYLFLKLRKSVSFQYFQTISHYLFKSLSNVANPQNDLLLKLRALAIAILSIILQREIHFTFNNNHIAYIDLASASQYFDQINDKFTRFLNTKSTKELIIQASNQSGVNNLLFFLQTVLIVSQQNMTKIRQYFDKWSSILKFFKHDYFNRKEQIFKLYSLEKLSQEWSQQTKFTKDNYRKWGIVGSSELNPEDYMLYATKKYGLQRNIKIYQEQTSQAQSHYMVFFPRNKHKRLVFPQLNSEKQYLPQETMIYESLSSSRLFTEEQMAKIESQLNFNLLVNQ